VGVGRLDLPRIFMAFREKCPTDGLDGELTGINDLQRVVCNVGTCTSHELWVSLITPKERNLACTATGPQLVTSESTAYSDRGGERQPP
jgi:hypothetical protein